MMAILAAATQSTASPHVSVEAPQAVDSPAYPDTRLTARVQVRLAKWSSSSQRLVLGYRGIISPKTRSR